jgi:hypothetical protein
MIKYYIGLLFILALSCKKEDTALKTKNSSNKKEALLTKEDIASIKFKDYLLDSKASILTSEWKSYQTISAEIEKIKSLNFDFFKKEKDIFNTTFKEFQTNIPEGLNAQPIRARALVLETHMYRLRDELGFKKKLYKSDLKYVKEVFVALSNLNLQINKKLEKEAQIIIKPY